MPVEQLLVALPLVDFPLFCGASRMFVVTAVRISSELAQLASRPLFLEEPDNYYYYYYYYYRCIACTIICFFVVGFARKFRRNFP